MKRHRTLHTEEEVARVRRRAQEDPEAKQVLGQILAKADEWARRDDAWLGRVITPASVPRAFNAHHAGCPVHGTEYFKHGNYSFRFSLDRPWKVVCPVGGEEYPSNDFGAFFASGMKDRSLLTGDYPDDGWGWRRPGDPKKWWFVAYYNHWAWMQEIIPGVLALSRAYLLTGDGIYAHKAGLLLHRIADVYPEMDHNQQSRWATEFAPKYTGRIVNMIWECGVASNLSEAYDNIFDGIERAKGLQERLGRSSAEIHAHIDRNLMAEFVRGVYDKQIYGNYGMHQHTLMTAALVRQAGDEQEVVDFLLRTTGSPHGYSYEGIDRLMDNLIYRDGISVTETSPSYAWIWPERVFRVAEMMQRMGIHLYQRHPKMLEMLLHPLRATVIGRFTPAVGDAYAVTTGHTALPRWAAEVGWREYRDPRLLDYLRGLGEERAELTYEELFRETEEHLTPHPPSPKGKGEQADLLPSPFGGGDGGGVLYDEFNGAYNHGGYGLALMRAGRGGHSRAVSLWYGTSIGHGHLDKLNVEVFAKGRKVLPDLGYPQFTDDHPERDAWNKNTVSHCTVVVDARMQTRAAKGDLHLFAAAPWVQVAEASAETNYPGIVSMYRRTVGMVDVSGQDSYVVDLFRVTGGRQHDYSLHGPDGAFEASGLALSEPSPGTLAGDDVPYTFLYDDPELSQPGAQGFGRYKGSGFSYIRNPQRGTARSVWRATWQLKDADGNLTGDRMTILRVPVGDEETFIGDGIPPFKPGNPASLKYVVTRRAGEDLSSAFASLFVPHTGDLFIRSVRLLKATPGDGTVALAVEREGETDVVISSLDSSVLREVEGDIAFRGRFGVLTLDAQGKPLRATLVGGGELKKKGQGIALGGDVVGTVTGMDPDARTVGVEVDNRAALPGDLSSLVLREALVSVATENVPGRTHRTCGLRIFEASRSSGGGLTLGFGPQDLQVARVPVDSTDAGAGTVTTRAHLPLASVGYYDGAYATDGDGRGAARVAKVEPNGTVHLSGDVKAFEGKELRVFEVGPRDRVRVSVVGQWERT
ncbi:MAG: hypothetical protein A3F84_23350 [Candidatus Handelsmanbacteria bacterium RIFCSPLOWO2_12_FULL_64_10]|uniref:Heparinase II/III-like C-terminal domain-containing protein n=1 Tax=Handelsmanbacteria sp. (strain RIFCSPLOWO2_12_FULL_64_10) TaxID=1817868 RepID=A0A1F6CSY5_HANXR|nr:MAG: hypothetical protein A3F84_23350 [Candidatus Handelsmanbacteria bacterium RIFCSPLOWO2_12_FULL_64_10]